MQLVGKWGWAEMSPNAMPTLFHLNMVQRNDNNLPPRYSLVMAVAKCHVLGESYCIVLWWIVKWLSCFSVSPDNPYFGSYDYDFHDIQEELRHLTSQYDALESEYQDLATAYQNMDQQSTHQQYPYDTASGYSGYGASYPVSYVDPLQNPYGSYYGAPGAYGYGSSNSVPFAKEVSAGMRHPCNKNPLRCFFCIIWFSNQAMNRTVIMLDTKVAVMSDHTSRDILRREHTNQWNCQSKRRKRWNDKDAKLIHNHNAISHSDEHTILTLDEDYLHRQRVLRPWGDSGVW